MKTVCYYLLSFLFIVDVSFSQISTFQKTYGGIYNEEGNSICESPDGGFVIAADSFGILGDKDIYLLKIDSLGNILWTKHYGDNNFEFQRCIIPAYDGGYYLTGDYYSSWSGTAAYLFKVNSIGDSMWTVFTYGTMSERNGRSLVQTSDSGIVWGTRNNDIQSNNPYEVLKYTKNGNYLWQCGGLTFTTGAGGYGSMMQSTFDNNIICSTSEANVWSQPISMHIVLAKIDTGGNKLWSKDFNSGYACYANSVCQSTDSSFMIGGGIDKTGNGVNNWFLIKTKSNGDSVWTKTFSRYGEICAVQQTSDGGFIVAGTTGNTNSFDIALIKLDANGDSVWTKTFGGPNNDYAYHAMQTNDGGYIIVGYTESFGNGGRDIYVIKTDSSGNFITDNEYLSYKNEIKIFPNPATDVIHIKCQTNTGKLDVTMKDLTGKTISQKHFSGNSSENIIYLPENISPGIYLLEINLDGKKVVKKLAVIK